jgi:hypothetical protein
MKNVHNMNQKSSYFAKEKNLKNMDKICFIFGTLEKDKEKKKEIEKEKEKEKKEREGEGEKNIHYQVESQKFDVKH